MDKVHVVPFELPIKRIPEPRTAMRLARAGDAHKRYPARRLVFFDCQRETGAAINHLNKTLVAVRVQFKPISPNLRIYWRVLRSLCLRFGQRAGY